MQARFSFGRRIHSKYLIIDIFSQAHPRSDMIMELCHQLSRSYRVLALENYKYIINISKEDQIISRDQLSKMIKNMRQNSYSEQTLRTISSEAYAYLLIDFVAVYQNSLIMGVSSSQELMIYDMTTYELK